MKEANFKKAFLQYREANYTNFRKEQNEAIENNNPGKYLESVSNESDFMRENQENNFRVISNYNKDAIPDFAVLFPTGNEQWKIEGDTFHNLKQALDTLPIDLLKPRIAITEIDFPEHDGTIYKQVRLLADFPPNTYRFRGGESTLPLADRMVLYSGHKTALCLYDAYIHFFQELKQIDELGKDTVKKFYIGAFKMCYAKTEANIADEFSHSLQVLFFDGNRIAVPKSNVLDTIKSSYSNVTFEETTITQEYLNTLQIGDDDIFHFQLEDELRKTQHTLQYCIKALFNGFDFYHGTQMEAFMQQK